MKGKGVGWSLDLLCFYSCCDITFAISILDDIEISGNTEKYREGSDGLARSFSTGYYYETLEQAMYKE